MQCRVQKAGFTTECTEFHRGKADAASILTSLWTSVPSVVKTKRTCGSRNRGLNVRQVLSACCFVSAQRGQQFKAWLTRLAPVLRPDASAKIRRTTQAQLMGELNCVPLCLPSHATLSAVSRLALRPLSVQCGFAPQQVMVVLSEPMSFMSRTGRFLGCLLRFVSF